MWPLRIMLLIICILNGVFRQVVSVMSQDGLEWNIVLR